MTSKGCKTELTSLQAKFQQHGVSARSGPQVVFPGLRLLEKYKGSVYQSMGGETTAPPRCSLNWLCQIGLSLEFSDLAGLLNSSSASLRARAQPQQNRSGGIYGVSWHYKMRLHGKHSALSKIQQQFGFDHNTKEH